MSDTVRIYKNSQMFNDLIMINIKDKDVTETKQEGAITSLFNEEELVGINVFDKQLSDHFEEGFNYPTRENLDYINDYLKDYQFTYDGNKHLLVGQVISFEPVAGSDKLNLCEVLIKDTTYSIVCGAANVEENMKTIVALDNALLPDGTLIKAGKVLGVHSDGMLCSKRELGFAQKPEEKGIIKLEDQEVLGLGFFDIDWRKYNV